MPIRIEATSGGLLLPVRVQAGARRNHVGGVHDGRLKVSVTQAPEKGKANREVLKLLASALRVRRSVLVLHSGETSPRKVVRVVGMEAADLQDRLSPLIED
jgi:uncharacterized protein (TIGR00251 family)